MKTYAFRILANQDLRVEIDKFVKQKNIRAGCILTIVGNLKKAVLRMAGAKIIKTYKGDFEIVSLVGTLESGNSHLHISLSDSKGKVFGGHLKTGSIVGVTAEVVIGELTNVIFTRKFDKETGYDELVIN
jgi:uncharacterized protein